MKNIIFILLLFISFIARGQALEDTNRYFRSNGQYGQLIPRGWFPKVMRIPNATNSDLPKYADAIRTDSTHKKIQVFDGVQWNDIASITNNYSSDSILIGQDTLNGGAFSSVPQVGFNPGTNLTAAQIVQAAFYASQPPIAGLSGGQTIELMGAGADLPFTLTWTAGRGFATQAIATIEVNGISQTFTQPPLNGSTSGTTVVTAQRNINVTYVNEVTTTDNKVTTATTAINFAAKRYAGWTTTNNPADALIRGGLLAEFSSTRAKGTPTALWTVPAPSEPSYFFYAYPSSFGDLQHFVINGFESINSFTLIKRNVQNASGYIQQYNIYISNNQLSFGLSNQVQ